MEISLFNENIPMYYLPCKFAEAHSCKERQGTTGDSSAEGYEGDDGAGASPLWGKAEGAGSL